MLLICPRYPKEKEYLYAPLTGLVLIQLQVVLALCFLSLSFLPTFGLGNKRHHHLYSFAHHRIKPLVQLQVFLPILSILFIREVISLVLV